MGMLCPNCNQFNENERLHCKRCNYEFRSQIPSPAPLVDAEGGEFWDEEDIVANLIKPADESSVVADSAESDDGGDSD